MYINVAAPKFIGPLLPYSQLLWLEEYFLCIFKFLFNVVLV